MNEWMSVCLYVCMSACVCLCMLAYACVGIYVLCRSVCVLPHALQCNAMQCNAAACDTMRCSATSCDMSVMQCSVACCKVTNVCMYGCMYVRVRSRRERSCLGASDFQMPTEWELGLGGPLGI